MDAERRRGAALVAVVLPQDFLNELRFEVPDRFVEPYATGHHVGDECLEALFEIPLAHAPAGSIPGNGTPVSCS